MKDTIISTYYPVEGMSAEDYAIAFTIGTIYGRSGADKKHVYNDRHVSRLPQKVTDVAYSLGQKQKSGAEAENKKSETNNKKSETNNKKSETNNKKASVDNEGGKKYSIAVLDDGRVYVIADRKIITGNDKSTWRAQITQFFGDLLEGKPSLEVETVEGDVLTITKNETANKARDNRKQVSGSRVPMNDAEFKVKLNAEAHIDELAIAAQKNNRQPVADGKDHDFAKDGFTYRTVYFQDFDKKYYRITLSIGHDGDTATVYNVGNMKEDTPPTANLIAVVGSKGPWNASSDSSISQPTPKVNISDEKSFRRSSREGRVIRADGVNMQSLNDRQYAAYKAAEIMARALGADIVIHADLGKTKNGKAVNGYFDEKTGQIHVNINAMRDGEHIALYTLSHEVTHYVKAWSGERYAALEEFVFEQLENGPSGTPVPTIEDLIKSKVEALKAAGLLPKGATEAQAWELAREEVVCDGMELVLADGEVLRDLAAHNKTLWEKIKDVVLRIIDRVKAAYASLSGTSKTAQVLTDTMESLDEMKRLFTEAAAAAGDARRSGEDADLTRINAEKMQVNEEMAKWSISDKNLSYATNFQKRIEAWDGSTEGFSFVIGETPLYLSNIEVGGKRIGKRQVRLDASKVKKIMRDHSAMTIEVIKQLPFLLNDPILVLDSKTVPDRLILLGEVYAEGKPVMMVLEINPTTRSGNSTYVDVIKIASAYTRSNAQNMINTSKVRFVHQNESRVNDWLKVNRLQLPLPNSQSNSANNSITENVAEVNPQSKKFSVDDANTGIEPFTSMDEYAVEGEILPEKPATDREILSGALEGAVRSKGEYNALKEYREQLTELDSVVEKRKTLKKAHADIVKRIKELKGIKKRMHEEPSPNANGTDMVTTEVESDSWIDAEIAELKKAKDEIKRQIDDADSIITEQDKKLLELQATKPIRELIQHAKKQAANKARQRDAEKLQRTKESYEKRLFKAKEREERRVYKAKAKYKKMYDDRQLGKDTTEARNSLRKEIDRLNRMLFVPNKKWHIPPEMQRAVAEALASTNMDTVGLQNIAKINAEIERLTQRANKGADVSKALNEQLEKREKWEGKSAGMQEQMSFLSQLYAQITASEGDTVHNMFTEEISSKLYEYRRVVGNTPIADMTLVQLRAAKEFYDTILTRVGNANQLFLDGKQAELDTFVEDIIEEVEKSKKPAFMKPKHGELGVLSSVRKYIWKALKPVYAFEIFGSDSMMSIFWSLQRGEGVGAKDCADAEKKFKSSAEKHHYWDWDFESKREFEVANGKKVKLTLGEILSLYALINRPPAYHHLTNGGFAFHSEAVEKGKWGEERVKNDFERYRLDDKTAEEITGALSDEQRAFADDMIEYLSVVMGEKGNEISVQLYGAALFGDKHYFPMEVLDTQVNSQTGRTGDSKITNKSMTKQIAIDPEERATNTLVLRDFMEVWTRHVNDMSLYHGMALPTENLSKILNYRYSAELNKDTGEWSGTPYKKDLPSYSFKDSINKEYGPEAIKYIEQLLRDLNGGIRSGTPTNAIDKGISLFKKSAVMASWSTIIQQPTSICRAWELIDAKYFVNTGYNPQKSRELWEELKEYAPVAIVKEMGGFDTGVGQATGDYITERDYDGVKDKLLALKDDKNYRDRALGFLAQKADELTWIQIWEACKLEAREKNPKLAPDSSELLTLAGERFSEVITRTQVYDSTLSRSAFMRSKDSGAKMLTAR